MNEPVQPSASPRSSFWELPDRRVVGIAAAACGVVFVVILTVIFPANSRAATLLLARNQDIFPFTVQVFEHILFFIGLGEMFVRWRTGRYERSFVGMKLLPEDEKTVLQAQDLGPIRKRVARMFSSEHGFLPGLIDLGILQFQGSKSVDQTVAVMNSSLELIQHRVDMRYSIIRYLAWLIPTMGFIGTVIGLGSSLALAGQQANPQLQEVASHLGLGFDCTLVALVESAILVLLLHIVQEQEEMSLNLAGSYALRNLVNRLYVG